jgi:hypothetical protein
MDRFATYAHIRVELIDRLAQKTKQVCRIVYFEIPRALGDARREVPIQAPTKPPRNFIVGAKDRHKVGIAFLIHPYWLWLDGYKQAGSLVPDTGFLEVDLNTEARDCVPCVPRPRWYTQSVSRLDDTLMPIPLAHKSGCYDFYEDDLGMSVSRFFAKHLPKSEIYKLLEDEKLRLQSLKYEKDRWILQGEFGEHGFEIVLQEMTEVVRDRAVRIKEPWRVIRWGDRPEPDPQMPVPLIVKLNKIWRLR